MRIAEVIGKVTLARPHDSLRGGTFLVVAPLTQAGINGDPEGRGEPFIAYDELGAREGSLVGISEGGEAAAPFKPNEKPVDAYNAAILDQIDIV